MSTLRVDNIQDSGGAERRGLKTYAIICDQKTSSADGGGFTNGAWRTRDLNTEVADPDNIVSISSNQFTLIPGTYLIKFRAPACQCNSNQAKLYDVTGSSDVVLGSAEYAGTSTGTTSDGAARVTITTNNTYEIRHRCGVTRSSYGFGVGSSGSINWGDTVYTIVEIYKEA